MSQAQTARLPSFAGGVVLVALSAAIVWTAGCGSGPAEPKESLMQETVSRDGTRIAWRRTGSGPPLVLVHGTTADHTRWARLLPELERIFTVYAIDRRGRGSSGDGPEYAIEREFEDIAAVVEAIGEPVSLLGHSYGGTCSLGAALLTDRVQRLVLYEPVFSTETALYPAGVIERIEERVEAGDPEAGLEVFFREIVEMPEEELAMFRTLPAWQRRIAAAPTIPRETRAEQLQRFVADRYAALQTPVLLLLGGESPPEFQQITRMLDDALPNSQVVVLPGQRHVAMDTAPDLFLREVIAFLTDSR